MDSDAEWILESNSRSQPQDPHVVDLNERRRISLREIDNTHFSYGDSIRFSSSLIHLSPSWIHAKICFVAGIGFFTDA